MASTKKRVKVDNPIEARVELVNGMFDLPPESKQAMNVVRQAAETYARALKAATEIPGVKYDTGRVIAALDGIQASKDVACVAFILPHASKEVPDT